MARQHVTLLTVLLVLMFISPAGYAQVVKDTLGIHGALILARENDPELNRLEEEVEVLKSELGPAWGIESPELFYFREGINGNSFLEQRWGVSQSFSFPLTGYYRNQRVSAEVNSAGLNIEAAALRLKAEVKQAYVELAYAVKNINLVDRRVQLSRELRDIARARLEVGESSEIDLIQADIQLSEAENDLREAERLYDNARYALFRIVGLDPDRQRYEIIFPDTLAYFNASIEQDAVMAKLEAHPEVLLSVEMVSSAEAGIKAATSSYLPDLRVDFYRQDLGNDYRFNGFEVGVSIPLWFGLNESNRVQRAKAQHRQAEWAVSERILNIKEQAEQAWHGYETSQATIRTYTRHIQERTTSLLDLTREGYRIGELELLRLLEAQRTYLNSEQRYYQALREYYIQVIQLERFLQTELIFK